jgi:hypothetical protein
MKSCRIVFILFATLLFSLKGFSQSDTLHIYYRGLETKVLDSTEAKIAKWAKSLNGKKVDIEVISYYNDAQFKKYSQERCDELFIIVNRKARELINITFIGPKKGAKSQRSKADIVYTYKDATVSTSVPPAAAVIPAAAATGAAATAVPAKKAAKETPAPAAQSSASITPEGTTAPATNEKKPKEEKPAKVEKANSKYDVIMDTTYVNGVMKVTKRKVKKQQ